MSIYYLYSKDGWMSSTGQFTSDRTKASALDEGEAIETCNRFKENSRTVVPVPAALLGRIK